MNCDAGFVDPQELLFAREGLVRVRDVAEKRSDHLDAVVYEGSGSHHRG